MAKPIINTAYRKDGTGEHTFTIQILSSEELNSSELTKCLREATENFLCKGEMKS